MDMNRMEMNRREFLINAAAVGGGLAIGITWSDESSAAFVNPEPWAQPLIPGTVEFTPWVSIGKDNIVTVRVTSPDLGNGIMTQFAMTLTEELNCDWSKVRAEYAPANRNLKEKNVYSQPGGILGYFSGRSTGPERTASLLQVGASARERLKEAAAQSWGVPRAEVEAKNSVVSHKKSGKKLTYGEIAEKAAVIKLDSEPKPKDAKDWWFLGKASPVKLQLPLITNGSAVYGIDVKLPDMVYAALMQSPVHGGKLKSYDFEKVKNMPGVRGVAVVDPSEPRAALDPKIVPFPLGLSAPQSAIAVIADHYWQAKKALEAMPMEWDDGPGAQWKNDAQVVKAAKDALDREGKKIEVTRGKPLELLDKQAKVVEGTYYTPYCDHVTMEPLNGTCKVTADRVDVWHPSQHSQQGLFVTAHETGVAPENVYVHQTWVGGGFGRRVYSDDIRMVAAVAKKFPGRPVKVIWSREESMRQGRFRALEAAKLRAGLGADGMPVAFHVRSTGGPGKSVRYLADGPHASGMIENVQVESDIIPLNILTGPYRGPGYNSNSFFIETFFDECAVAAGIDPMEYRLKLFAKWPDKGWTKCLNEVKTKARWGRKLPKGWGQGVAIVNWGMGGKPEHGTTVAAVATVEVSKQGVLRIDSIDIAFDTGRIANRDAIAAQIEGGVIFGLNMALNEQLTVENGRIVEGNYHEYPMLRIGDMPKRINVHYGGLSGHERMAEIGEPPVGAVGPAVGNAIFKATGKRVRAMPFRLQDLSWT